MIEFTDSILIPYVTATRQRLQLPMDSEALTIFDVFSAHRCETVLKKLTDTNIKLIFIPGVCTGDLQPLDISDNDQLKKDPKAEFSA